MSFASFVVLLLLGYCSIGMMFVLPSPEKEPSAPSGRCLEHMLQAIRNTLLHKMKLQTEPRLPAGGVTEIREQWKAAFNAISHTARNKAVPVVNSESPAVVNSTEPTCCQTASQILMKDLGWENWVIYPESFTFVKCAPCNAQRDLAALHCPSHSLSPAQMPCCQHTSQELLPILYMDEDGSMVIASVQLTRTCGCGPPV